LSEVEDGAYEGVLAAAVIELTNRCNSRCLHCASNSGAARVDELPTARWLTLMEELRALGCEEVTLIGGEVFLHPDWLAIAQRVVDLGVGLSIVTNGLFIGPEKMAALLSLPLLRLGVSLDAADPVLYRHIRGVDGYSQALDFIDRFVATGHAPVNAVTTFTRLNAGHFEAIEQVVRGLGVSWQIQFAHDVSERFTSEMLLSPDDFRVLCGKIGDLVLAAELDGRQWIVPMDDFGYFPLDPLHAPIHARWSGCQAGLHIIGVRANGDLLGCLSLGDPFIEGNLRERSLVEIWRDPASFAKLRRKGGRLEGSCAACDKAEVCRAGCPCMAYASTGDIYENHYCLRHLERQELLALLVDEDAG